MRPFYFSTFSRVLFYFGACLNFLFGESNDCTLADVKLFYPGPTLCACWSIPELCCTGASNNSAVCEGGSSLVLAGLVGL
jgi:hypothetical protein